MSDNSIALAPKKSTYIGNKEKAIEVLNWLISKDIVKPEPSDCVLGSDEGYAISNGAKEIVQEPQYLPFDLTINGLEIVTERQVFPTIENFPENVICPSCNENIVEMDWDFVPWAENRTDNLTCPSCGRESEIHDYDFDWQWGFSDLGFVFWNWPEFRKEFIQEFKEKLNCDINIVYCRI